MAYHSDRRQKQAEETRGDILGAARRLFAEEGYVRTSMQDIAKAAGVTVPTIYASVGKKPALALSLVPFISEEAGVEDLILRQRGATSAYELLEITIHFTRVLNERCGDIIQALLSGASASEDLVPAEEEGRRTHRESFRQVVREIAKMGQLREGVTEIEATVAAVVLTSPDAYRSYVREHGWTFSQAEEWLQGTLRRLLLRS